MVRRKPRPHERAELYALCIQLAQVDTTQRRPYEVAFEWLGTVPWLHSQSRDGIAAAVSKFMHDVENGDGGVSPMEYQLAFMKATGQHG